MRARCQPFKFNSILLSMALLPFLAVAQTLNGFDNIKDLCENASPSERALATQAGIDFSEICGGRSRAESDEITVLPPYVMRSTVSSSDNVAVEVAPVAVAGTEPSAKASDLKPFGYDLFANSPSTYAPASSVPVSSDYLLGPGDSLNILFYGKSNKSLVLRINREGFVDFPELGPVGLAGMTFGEAKEMLEARIANQIIGTQVSISMGKLRSMQIFVLGEAYKPGAYTISSLSTITHALGSSGGVSDIGSLREIQLKRGGKIIKKLDLYDLLLKGKTRNDVRLQAADVIYIPTVKNLVSIEGQILRPAIYELLGGETVEDLISLAGGFGPKAFKQSSRLERINSKGFINVIDLNLDRKEDRSIVLEAGDHLSVDSITNFKSDIVSLIGSVRHGGDFEWKSGMKISDILSDKSKFLPDSDLKAVLIIRELTDSTDIEVFKTNVEHVFIDPESKENIFLAPRDTIVVLSHYENRASLLESYVANLKRQAGYSRLPQIVRSGGTVRYPGEYPLIRGMSVQDLIDISGGLTQSAYSLSAEISRVDLSNPNKASISILTSSLGEQESTYLSPMDYVEFRTIPDYSTIKTVTLSGEFIFPGVYAFEKGETLSSVINRAGGFTDDAFVNGSIFLREELKQRERNEIDRLSAMVDQEIATQKLKDANSDIPINSVQLNARQDAIDTLRSITPIGRLVIPLNDILDFSETDILLKDGDRLIIPKLSQEVTVLGEVHRPTSYLYDPTMNVSGYIEKSGGFMDRADKKAIYIVKANGDIIIPEKNLFKFRSVQQSIAPGDTIVVPLDSDDSRLAGLPLIAEVSQIVYQLSLGAAVINSFKD